MAAAAYRAGVKLEDHRTAMVFDFTRRSGVVAADIVAPGGAGEFARDRAVLWNAAEKVEKRKDSRTAREWILALPAELDAERRADLARDFARELVDRYGVAADVAIHTPSRDGDDRNHHAHILCTTRVVFGDTLGEKCELELSDAKRKTLGLVPAADEISTLRQRWAELANAALEKSGSAARIDHRSLVDQQAAAFERGDLIEALALDRAAQMHVGAHATQLDCRSGQIVSLRGQTRERAIEATHQAASTAKRWAPILIDAERDEATALVRAEIGAVWVGASPAPANDIPERRAAEIIDLETEQQRREQTPARSKIDDLEQVRQEMLEAVPAGMNVRRAFQNYLRQREANKRAEKEAATEAKRAAEQTPAQVKVDELEQLHREMLEAVPPGMDIRAAFYDHLRQQETKKRAEKEAAAEAKRATDARTALEERKEMAQELNDAMVHLAQAELRSLTLAQLKAEKSRLETWPDPGKLAEDDPRFKEAQTKSQAVAKELKQLGQNIKQLKGELEDHKAAHSLRTWLHEITLAGRALIHDRKRMAIEDAERKQEKQLAERTAAWEELEKQNRALREKLKAEKEDDAGREMVRRWPRLEAFNTEIQRREAQADLENPSSDLHQKSPQFAQPQSIDDDKDMDF